MERKEGSFTIGYYLSKKKLEAMQWASIVQFAKDTYNITCIPMNLESTDLPDKSPYDIVIHKFTDELSDPDNVDNIHKINMMECLLKKYPTLIEVDPLACQKPLVDRLTMSNLLDKLNELPANLNIKNPKFLVLEQEKPNYDEELKDIMFPVVCKTVQACGSRESHQMAIFFNKEELSRSKTVKLPMLVQEYINHNAIIYKVFVIGDYLNVVHRKSLRNLNTTETETLTFDSQKPLPANLLPEIPYDESMVDIPSRDSLVAISKGIQKDLGLTLFGFDVITDITTKKIAVIDVNYFPGYVGIPDFNKILIDHMLYIHKSKSNGGIN
ncbi:hypothetical protein SAMD00019534_079450 [Acytostelium subglobosum LB1]|uniref:hypothetical protein n=1 Tax=Acytostelium subglobosum LB1 TaxID=1410327 RepID=UPI000644EA35|nr:hypothetical protein SAMD00019534_079450 [Acytostelium subglobosum LB1]GAM24770.1 hypothetical protein SAMD00019534_079450 [Acytostelium subglobosum LB1]|eukprot:XP_012752439.1 hypothetical protein SAMD00019534_079450 [Acytostelium subglobosum LB1]